MEQETALKLIETLELLAKNINTMAIMLGTFLAGIFLACIGAFYVEYAERKNDTKSKTIKGDEENKPEPAIEFDSNYADELYMRNKLDELIEYCSQAQEVYVNDIYVYWFQGLAYFRMEEPVLAKKNFEQVLKINPNWKESVEGYLNEIENLEIGSKAYNHQLQ